MSVSRAKHEHTPWFMESFKYDSITRWDLEHDFLSLFIKAPRAER